MTDYRERISRYIEMEKQALDMLSPDEISHVMNVLERARMEGRRIFIC